MIPIQFGSRDRQLFGLYTPASKPRKRRGALLLNPWGIEALQAHRSIKQLADFIAAAGIDAFRFDYFGTGDSFGSGNEVTLAGCLEDAEWAMNELAGTASISRVTVIGLRMGALVAGLLAARHSREVDQVVFWDPISSGRDYLAEMCHRSSVPEAELTEFRGFEISPRFYSELATTTLRGLPGTRACVLLASSSAGVDAESFDLKAKKLDVLAIESPRCWEEERDFGAGAVPFELSRAITEWII